ncbi:MAG: carbohydrate porin, partial [Steroidobacteraceae bacterium]
TNTLGIYTGWAPLTWGQLYLDAEKFTGAAVSDGTGLGGPTNGNARAWRPGLNKQFYIARLYARFMLPLGDGVTQVERGADQVSGAEAARRLELKVGRMAAPDDFDQNRYAESARTEFLNWSLENNTAWDYAQNARGYSDGIVLGYISPNWSLKYGIYRMPAMADGQSLVDSPTRASGQNLQLTLSPFRIGTIVRVLAYLNTAAMGSYEGALSIAAAAHSLPNVATTDKQGRSKHGFGLNVEQPLADDGDTGLFLRWGWDDGREESFAFTEVDRLLSAGVQVDGSEWHQPDAQLGLGLVSEGLSGPHRQYLAAGGSGFRLGDGGLNYGPEQILEIYYRLQRIWPDDPGPVLWQFGPDIQLVRNPGYNRDRGTVSFWGLRLHVQY